MALKGLQNIQTSDEELNRVQEHLRRVLGPVLSCAIIDGRLIAKVALTSGKDNLIDHGLGRPLSIWTLAGINANSNVWEKTSPAPSSILNLWCTTSCTISLWVA